MNNLDPKLAKYLSSAKQEIYNEYHGTGKKKGSKKRKQPDSATSTVAGAGFVIADDDGVSWGNKADDDEEDAAVGARRAVLTLESMLKSSLQSLNIARPCSSLSEAQQQQHNRCDLQTSLYLTMKRLKS